ncbi:MAG TPA: AraC family transcriptional regulator, partial [Methylophaga sp.]|nr:AraC family transcriptional regulator [Methylophaga sp.]
MTNALIAPPGQIADGPDSLVRLDGQRFCTEQQPSAQRVEWLKEVIGREYANVDITPPQEMVLFNDMLIYPWQEGVRLSPIQSNAITLERLPQEPSHSSQDCYFMVLLTSGKYKLEQGGREVFLKPGEMTIY